MSYNYNTAEQIPTMSYSMEPGDGTRYVFSIQDLTDDDDIFVGTSGEYVNIVVQMERSQGSYPISKSSLKNLQWHTIQYMHGKMPNVDMHTLVAVLLAASVLAFTPFALDEAGARMLDARQVIMEKKV